MEQDNFEVFYPILWCHEKYYVITWVQGTKKYFWEPKLLTTQPALSKVYYTTLQPFYLILNFYYITNPSAFLNCAYKFEVENIFLVWYPTSRFDGSMEYKFYRWLAQIGNTPGQGPKESLELPVRYITKYIQPSVTSVVEFCGRESTGSRF